MRDAPGAKPTGSGTPLAASFFDQSKAKRLFDAVNDASAEDLMPRATPGIILAHGIAAIVHLTSIMLILIGIALLIWTWPNWLGVIFGAAMAIGGWFLLPRFGRPPEHIVTREQAPELHALTDEIAHALGTRPVDLIALDPDENASFSRIGLRRTSVLTLGLPLWRILDPQERVALIAHELAHQENGDVARGFLVVHALYTLDVWDEFLIQEPHPEVSVSDFAVRWILELIALGVRGIATILRRLFWTESQRAEYLADFLGSRVSGTEAFLRTNKRFVHLSAYPEALFDATMKTPARDPDYAAIFERYAVLLEEVSQKRADAARVRADNHYQDGTHPPTSYRSAFLANRPCTPTVTLDAAASREIDSELAPFGEVMGQMLVRRWANHFD